MDVGALRRRRQTGRNARRRRGASIAVISGVLVVVLVMGVFSVASLSRSVAQDSSRIHALDEVLKSVTIIRAQLGFGIVLADLDNSTAIDASAAVQVAADDVAASIADLEQALSFIDDELAGLEPETTAALDQFRSTVVSLQLDQPNRADATQDMIETFDRSYDETISLVAAERDDALDAVAETDSDLSQIGSLVNFLVAFVVPTAAFGIYRALTKPEAELLLTDAQLVRDTVLRALRRDLLLREVNDLGAVVAELPTPEHLGLTPIDRVDALRRTILTLDNAHETTFSAVDLRSALQRATTRLSERLTVSVACDDDVAIWSDPDALDALLASVLSDCVSAGADRIGFSVATSDEFVTIRLAKNGEIRSPAEIRMLSKQGTVAERISLLGGPDTSVVAALHLAEDLGGSLDLVEVGDQQTFVIELPRPATERKTVRSLVFGQA